MRLSRTRIAVAPAVLTLALAAGSALASAGPPAAGAVPQPGNWEGRGAHGLPLSFSLALRQGRLVATAIAVGAPLTCPATQRDAEAVPLSLVAYSGPGAAPAKTAGSAVLAGRVPGLGQVAQLTGQFTTPTTGTFSLQVQSSVGCGWPTQTLTWQVHRAHRERINDGVWAASLKGRGITAGRVTVRVAGDGRVVRWFRSSYTCESATRHGNGGFAAVPAYEFIRPDGQFYSPLHGNPLRGHRTLWSGRLTWRIGLSGILSIYDVCTGQVVQLRFRR